MCFIGDMQFHSAVRYLYNWNDNKVHFEFDITAQHVLVSRIFGLNFVQWEGGNLIINTAQQSQNNVLDGIDI